VLTRGAPELTRGAHQIEIESGPPMSPSGPDADLFEVRSSVRPIEQSGLVVLAASFSG